MVDASGRSGRDIFEILVREHADMLMAYLRSVTSDRAAVDDLFQEAMIVAWRRLDDYDRARPFGPWLRGIARRIVLAHHRQKATRPRWCSNEVLEAIDRRFDTLGARSGDTFRDRVDGLLECMRRLSERLRQVIELIYARGMKLGEIAVALGEPEEAVKKRAQRARKQLHDCLLGVEVTP